jgi:OOP family OmpA-OmpF porin
MTRTTKAFTSSLFGAGLAFALLTSPVAAQEARYWLNDASNCQVFRALSEVVPAACAEPGDTMLEGVRTRSWGGVTRSIRLHTEPAAASAAMPPAAPYQTMVAAAQEASPPAAQQASPPPAPEHSAAAAVKQANPPATKSINARILFDFDSFRLTDDAKAALDRLASVLNDDLMKGKKIEIDGHTDAVGTADYNLTLSQERAEAVRAYLVEKHGVAPERLPVVGKGKTDLYDPAHPDAAVNRRVVFTNLTG